ncbi:hypothetical protein FRAHR75_340038 [Frankia sp. Hr75.2]|nr:hypothetical protein FRAHR75_340038 [Frankia sp. Hr75.2]
MLPERPGSDDKGAFDNLRAPGVSAVPPGARALSSWLNAR